MLRLHSNARKRYIVKSVKRILLEAGLHSQFWQNEAKGMLFVVEGG
jgi:hypothetical protein